MSSHPVLFSYRRCPYAMRARMAIYASGLQVEQREIVFWDKPEAMLEASPKGEVPVLILADGQVIDESRDVMQWALSQRDGLNWAITSSKQKLAESLMDQCDFDFKLHLDHYKYADRFPEQPQQVYRQRGEEFIQVLESLLEQSDNGCFLSGERVSMLDVAIFPFVRQFAHVDKAWFYSSDYVLVQQWLKQHMAADYFLQIMKNRPVWQAGMRPLWVVETALQTRNQFVEKAMAN